MLVKNINKLEILSFVCLIFAITLFIILVINGSINNSNINNKNIFIIFENMNSVIQRLPILTWVYCLQFNAIPV